MVSLINNVDSARSLATLPRTPFEIVGPEIDKTRVIANTAINNANVFLNEILRFSSNSTLEPVTVSLPSNLIVSSDFRIPPVPIPPNLQITLPNLPNSYTPGTIRPIDLNQIGGIPVFTAVEPTIIQPGKPSPLSVSAPTTEPTIDTAINLPARPSTVLPPVPTFRQLNIPTLAALDFPIFDQVLPNVNSLVPPNLTFRWATESPYSSTLLTALKGELLDRIQNGGTGLNAVVEQAIYDRGKDRERKESVSVQESILKEQSARGWSRPSGAIATAIEQAVQEAQNKISDLNREILVQQAELEQKNIEFALQTTLSLEQSLIQENNEIMQRAFQAEQLVQQFSIEIYNARVAQLNLELESYKAFSASYEARIRAELAKVEAFKAQIEAQQLISEINKDDLQLYLGRIEGVKADAEIYRIIVDSINTQLQAENLKLELYKSQIQNYAAQVSAKRDEFAIFGEEVRAEQLKTDLFSSQVQAFISRIEAYSKQVDAQSTITQSDINFEEILLRRYLAQLDAVTKDIEARTRAFSANVDVFTGQTQLFNAQVGAESARLGVELKQIENNIANSRAIADVAIENARIAIANAQSVDELMLEALKAGATTYTALATSSLSALNVGAQISGSGSSSYSFSENHNFEEVAAP